MILACCEKVFVCLANGTGSVLTVVMFVNCSGRPVTVTV